MKTTTFSMIKKTTTLLLLLFVAITTLAESSVSFDRTGQLRLPDAELLNKARHAHQDNRPDEALGYLLQAARFGSNQAKASVAQHLLEDQTKEHDQWLDALAWLLLLQQENTGYDPATCHRIIDSLKQKLSSEELAAAEQKTTLLHHTYGAAAALQYRQDWRQNLRFTGSRIAGYIPNNLTVIPVEDGRPGTLTINLTGQQIRQQLDAFVNTYPNHNQVKKQTMMALMKLSQTSKK
ncbi:hypothetical protein OS175_00230 [Marinicella sp. S1101]|uniref:hypothetical protein n=1 Tax=Marinicella marina TaxID=2996016 RepID=UPI002260D114|nr:hypothetical protein [Marinicella marina]MCX7552288.1 hypothetical protein [Marinicella marina]MDJ1139164.1 hypothetical protein [Marinicella marina]